MTLSDAELRSKPETIRQARTWETVKGHYLEEGLCEKDAAQAAWGHQNGFTQIKDPCEECQKITLSSRLIEQHGIRGVSWLNGKWIKPIEN
jgi:hypothetical protein